MVGLLGKLVAVIVYLCIGTVIAQGICIGYAWSKGYVSKPKLLQMAAVAQGENERQSDNRDSHEKELSSEQPSLQDIENARALRIRNLELREQAIQAGLDRVRYEQTKLADERDMYLRTRAAFDAHLKNMKEGAIAKGRTDTRTILENIKPKQAKQQILQMIEAGEEEEVVAILSEMPVAKRAKIAGEFGKLDEDNQKLGKILRLIRQGVPEVSQIQDAQEELTAAQPNTK